MLMKQYIEKCLEGVDLTETEASAALELIMTQQATEAQIAGLLISLRAKGETVDELVGFARTMREKSVKVMVEDPDAVDIVGTGGDGLGTFNISTVAAFVAAGAGITIAKHGNKSVSSRCGSADLLSVLGVNIHFAPERMQACINKIGVGFLFAPLFHPAMKFAAKPRSELGVRTIFNMVGPLTNPAGVKRHFIGAYQDEVAAKLAGALSQLDARKACVVHNSNGMDEIGLEGDSAVYEVNGDDQIKQYSVHAGQLGFASQPLSAIQGGSAEENAAIALRVLGGDAGPARDVVLANAAFGIYVSGENTSIETAIAMAKESIDSGRARNTLRKLVEETNR